MNKIIFIASLIFSVFYFTSCEKQEDLNLSKFYDSYLISNIYLSVDTDVFFEGDPPVEFSAVAFDALENEVVNFDFLIVTSDGDTLEDRTFKPDKTSRTIFRAIVNDISSDPVKVDFINTSEIKFIDLSYEGSHYLTTNDWSLTGDFILTTIVDATVFTYDITKSNIPLMISDGSSTINRKGLSFDKPGLYEVNADFNGVVSNKIEFEVREEKDFEEIEFPIIYHCINYSPLAREVERAITSYNNIFYNDNITLNKNDLSDQWENPNWVNAKMRFRLVEEDLEGNTLSNVGIHLINTDQIQSEDQLINVINNNIWNPNKYINVFLTDDYEYIYGSQPFLSKVRLTGLETRGIDDGSGGDFQFISNGSDPFNSNTMGQFWGLFNTYECQDDYCNDTFNYQSNQKYKAFCVDAAGNIFNCRGNINDGGLYYQAKECTDQGEGQVFSLKNIMDDGKDDKEADTTEGGIELTPKRMREYLTFDQRDRMRVVIENAPLRPTPFNN